MGTGDQGAEDLEEASSPGNLNCNFLAALEINGGSCVFAAGGTYSWQGFYVVISYIFFLPSNLVSLHICGITLKSRQWCRFVSVAAGQGPLSIKPGAHGLGGARKMF